MWKFIKRRAPEAAVANLLPVELDLAGAKRVLVIAPHPDDESIGCGGTLARLAPLCEVQALLVTNGDGAGGLPPGASAVRKDEMRRALRMLGVQREPIFLDEPDGHFADSPAFQARLRDIIRAFAPNWVFLPWLEDSHNDHHRVAQACRPAIRGSGAELALFYEVWTPLPATHVVNITETVETKRAAIHCHETALQHGHYAEATLGLNAFRGIYLPAPTPQSAEAFVVRPAASC